MDSYELELVEKKFSSAILAERAIVF